jgi:hypothetical protein
LSDSLIKVFPNNSAALKAWPVSGPASVPRLYKAIWDRNLQF